MGNVMHSQGRLFEMTTWNEGDKQCGIFVCVDYVLYGVNHAKC